MISLLVVSQQQVDPRSTATLVAMATDPDPGDTLTYAWTSNTGGYFATSKASKTNWIPGKTGDSVVTVKVTDSHGTQSSASIPIIVWWGLPNSYCGGPT